MLSLHDKFDCGKRQSFYNTDKIITRSHMEDCDADCQETCKKCSRLSSAAVPESEGRKIVHGLVLVDFRWTTISTFG